MTGPVTDEEAPEVRKRSDVRADKVSTDGPASDVPVSLVPEGVEISVDE